MELENVLSRLIFESTKIRSYMRDIYDEIYSGIAGNSVTVSRFGSNIKSVKVRDISIVFSTKRSDTIDLAPAGTITVEKTEVFPKEYWENPDNFATGETKVLESRII